MATLITSGTQLEKKPVTIPLNNRFLFYIGLTFILGMHYFMRNPGGSGLALSFNPSTWICLSGAFGVGLYQMARSRLIRYTKYTLILLVGCLMLTLPALYTMGSGFNATSRLVGLWAGFVLFLLLQQFRFSNAQKQRLLWFIVIAIAIEACFGWVQYTLLEPGNIFGYNADRNRPHGIFQQPNVMASFLATGLVLSGYLLARQPQKKYDSRLRKILFLYSIPILTVPLLVVLASRTGWIGASISVALIIPYLVRFSTKKRISYWLFALVLGLGLGALLLNQGGKSEFVENKISLEGARTTSFPQTLDMMIEKPLTGYGYGQFESQYILYTARQHQLNDTYPPGIPAMDHPHNELMFWGVEGGIIPVLAIILVTVITLQRITSMRHGTRLAIFALLIPIALHAQLEYPFYHSAIHWITFIILLFWVDQKSGRYKTAKISSMSDSLLKVSSLVLPIVIVVFMATSLQSNHVLRKFEYSKQPDPSLLDKVTNPIVWRERLDWDIHAHLLNIGLKTKNPELIQRYVDWSLPEMVLTPRPSFYANLVMAYEGLGQTDNANRIKAESLYLFPNYDLEGVIIKHKEANNKALSKALSNTLSSAISVAVSTAN
jgi:O-antigen polymerase